MFLRVIKNSFYVVDIIFWINLGFFEISQEFPYEIFENYLYFDILIWEKEKKTQA